MLANVNSNKTLPCLVLIEYGLACRFSGGSIVGPTDHKVLHRPVELAAATGQVTPSSVARGDLAGLCVPLRERETQFAQAPQTSFGQ
jgi:hypothetical protein